MPTTVVNRKATQVYDVYIGRPSKWGNPYKIGPGLSRAMVIVKYREHLLQHPELLRDVHELKGKILGCWCKPLPCHGDVLAALADAEAETWYTCPDCRKIWRDEVATPGIIHRLRLCEDCYQVHQHDSDAG